MTILIAVSMLGWGLFADRLVSRPARDDADQPAFALLAGWAFFSTIAVLCALAGLAIAAPMIAVGLGGLVGFALFCGQYPQLRYLALAWLLLAPLLWLASLVPPTMYDEFSHWIPNARYLLAHDAFPSAGRPNVWSAVPGYPPASPLIGYLAGSVVDGAVETAPKLFTLLLAGAFGLALAELLAARLPMPIAVALGVTLATVLNPFFDPRIALTSYTDVPTAFALALCVVACWRSCQQPGWRWWWRIAAAAIVLVLMRESNIVLALTAGLGLLLLRNLPGAVAVTASGLAGALLWRAYLWIEAIGTPLAPAAMAGWEWAAPWAVFWALIAERAWAHPVLAGASAAIVAALIVFFVAGRRVVSPSVRRLLGLALFVAAIWTAFLAWSYAAVFDPAGAPVALSAWRYWGQVGPTLVYAAVAVLADAGDRILLRLGSRLAAARRPLRAAAAASFSLAPAVLVALTYPHWRIDCRFPDVAVARSVARSLEPVDFGDSRLAIVHPSEAGWYANVVGYELGRPFGWVIPAETTGQAESRDLLVDLTGLDRGALLAGGAPPQLRLERRSGGEWRELSTLPLHDGACFA